MIHCAPKPSLLFKLPEHTKRQFRFTYHLHVNSSTAFHCFEKLHICKCKPVSTEVVNTRNNSANCWQRTLPAKQDRAYSLRIPPKGRKRAMLLRKNEFHLFWLFPRQFEIDSKRNDGVVKLTSCAKPECTNYQKKVQVSTSCNSHVSKLQMQKQ